MDALPIAEAQICAGFTSSADPTGCVVSGCLPLSKSTVGSAITNGIHGSVNGMSNDVKKMIGCFSGQCLGSSYTTGFFWECREASCDTGDVGGDNWKWSNSYGPASWTIPGTDRAYTGGIGPHPTIYGGDAVWHVWSSGYSLITGSNHELYLGTSSGALNIFQVRYKRAKVEYPSKCTGNDDWKYLAELADDTAVEDWPDDASTIAAGFKNGNAFYIGNDAVNSLSFNELQLCGGSISADTCDVSCFDLREQEVGGGLSSGQFSVSGMSSNLKQMVGCFSGQCVGDSYSQGFFWECQESWCDTGTVGGSSIKWSRPYDGQPWTVPHSGAYTGGIGPHTAMYGGTPAWHVWNSGQSLIHGNTRELVHDIGGDPNRNYFAIRYK